MAHIEKPYIGVTGISTETEAEIIADTFFKFLPETATHQGMSGYLVSNKSLIGIRGKNKYPDVADLPKLLDITKRGGLNAIHYTTRNRLNLGEEVARLFTKGNIYADDLCRALQLNTTWPDIKQIEQIRINMPELQFILVMTPKIIQSQTRFEIEDRIADYQEIVDFVLIDPSGGQGGSFESNAITPIYTSIKDSMRTQTMIVSGGFSEKNVEARLSELAYLLRTKQFGIDAEDRLRDKPQVNLSVDGININRAVSYIQLAANFLLH